MGSRNQGLSKEKGGIDMGLIREFLRVQFGRCPVCGGHLTLLQHCCVEGDLMKCDRCYRTYRIQ